MVDVTSISNPYSMSLGTLAELLLLLMAGSCAHHSKPSCGTAPAAGQGGQGEAGDGCLGQPCPTRVGSKVVPGEQDPRGARGKQKIGVPRACSTHGGAGWGHGVALWWRSSKGRGQGWGEIQGSPSPRRGIGKAGGQGWLGLMARHGGP